MTISIFIILVFCISALYKRKLALFRLQGIPEMGFKRIKRKKTVDIGSWWKAEQHMQERKAIKKLNRKCAFQMIFGSLGTIMLLLSVFFLYTYLYYPIEYVVKSDSRQETVSLPAFHDRDDVVLYAAKHVSEDKTFYYYFIEETDGYRLKTLPPEEVTVQELDEEEIPAVQKETVLYTVSPQYRNWFISYMVHDFFLDRHSYFQFDEQQIKRSEITEEYFTLRVPGGDVPELPLDRLHFEYKQ